MFNRVFLSGVLIASIGCATGERMQRMREGMSKDEVIAVLGNPDGFQRSGDYEATLCEPTNEWLVVGPCGLQRYSPKRTCCRIRARSSPAA